MSTPAMVPWTTVPFFSSIDTVSLFSFIKNLTSFMATMAPARFQKNVLANASASPSRNQPIPFD